MERVTSRDRRALTFGAAALALAWIGLRVVPSAVRAEARLSERVAERASELRAVRRGLAGLDAMEDSAASINARLVALAPRLLTGDSQGEAASQLSVELRKHGEAVHARVDRVIARPDTSAAGPLVGVQVRMELETDAAGLEAFLTRVRTADLALVADELQVTAVDPRSLATREERLHVVLQVHAWWLASAAGDSTPTVPS